MLLSQGRERFGEPAPDWAAAALAQMENLEQLEPWQHEFCGRIRGRNCCPNRKNHRAGKKAGLEDRQELNTGEVLEEIRRGRVQLAVRASVEA